MALFFMSKKEYLINWIKEISELRPELGGFAVCPYARSAVYEIIECSVGELSPVDGYDVIIFIVDDELRLGEIQKWVEFYNEKYKNWKFFEDCASYDTFINGIKTNNGKYNLILAQPKEKLRKFREKLTKTEYYSYWEDEYLEEILENDYKLLESWDRNPIKSSDSPNQEKK
jgi:hypothetical protein